MTNVDAFILGTLRKFPDRELLHKDMIRWFIHTTGKEPDFERFHLRDACYRLENKGLIVRYKEPGDRGFYWGVTLKGLAAA